MIEVHLRMSDQWPDLYGAGWLDAVVRLYAQREWAFADRERRNGYSVVLFGPHGPKYRHPPAALLARVRSMPGVSSVQITFHEGKGSARTRHAARRFPAFYRECLEPRRRICRTRHAERVFAWPGCVIGAHQVEGVIMKIVGFEADGGWHLGVLEGDEVVDLQSVDKTIPGDLGEVLRGHNGDLSSLREAAKRAPSTARRHLPWYQGKIQGRGSPR